MNKNSLTERQQEIYDFLKDKIVTGGYCPSVREIGVHFGIKSPNGVMGHLKALQKKGLISREAHMSRAIQLTEISQSEPELPDPVRRMAGAPLSPSTHGEDANFSCLFNMPDYCCVRVQGTELQHERVAPGDVLIVHRKPTFRDGDVAIVAFDDGTTGFRRLYQESQRIRMESVGVCENPQFVSRIIVIGTVVGVIRQF